MTFDLVIRGGEVITPQGRSRRDLAISEGKIAAILSGGAEIVADATVDADGLIVMPGGIDAHVHLDAPGRAHWEGWESGTLAALAGGVTTLFDMPIDCDPPTTTRQRLETKRALAERESLVDFALWGGLIDDNPERIRGLLAAGCIGLKAFLCPSGWEEFPPIDLSTLERGATIAREYGAIIGVHCELGEDEAARHSIAGEVAAVSGVITIARSTGAHFHLVHISSPEAVVLAHGIDQVSVESCAHYLTLDSEQVKRIGSTALCAPPVRDGARVAQLWECLLRGEIDMVASDHSPCDPSAREGASPFFGIDGIETTLSLLAGDPRMDLERLVALRTAAARRFSIPSKGAIAVGYDADLALFDPTARWTVTPEELHSRHRSSPFLGRELLGRVQATYVRGRLCYEAGEQVGDPTGRWLQPERPVAVVEST